MFNAQQIEELSAKLDRSHVKERVQAGRKLSYVEGWHAIAEANRIFGYDAWTRETLDLRMVAERERAVGQGQGFGVTYIAKVRVIVDGVAREGIGAGHGIDRDLGLAHESAVKEAETDAMKRALMTFGNPFGLALYDKTQENVETSSAPPRAESSRRASNAPPLSPGAAAATLSVKDRLIAAMAGQQSAAALFQWWSNAKVQEAYASLAIPEQSDIDVAKAKRLSEIEDTPFQEAAG